MTFAMAYTMQGYRMRIDRYDIIGIGLLAVVAAVWILHFALPAPPPEPEPGQGLPALGPPQPGLRPQP